MIPVRLRLIVLALCWAALGERMQSGEDETSRGENEGPVSKNSTTAPVKALIHKKTLLRKETFQRDHALNDSKAFGPDRSGNDTHRLESNSSKSLHSKTIVNAEAKYLPSFPLNDPRIFLLSENHHLQREQHYEKASSRSSEDGRGEPISKADGGHSSNSTDIFPIVHRKHHSVVEKHDTTFHNNKKLRNNFTHKTNTVVRATTSGRQNASDHRNNSVRHRAPPPPQAKRPAVKRNQIPRNFSAHQGVAVAASASEGSRRLDARTTPVTNRGSTPARQAAAPAPAPTPSSAPSTGSSDEEYYSYAEYPDLVYNSSGYDEAGVLPEPEADDQVEEVDEEVPVALPDDSLVDTDLHDHDLIDSVMYIYFGSSERDQANTGRQVSDVLVAAVGGVAALAAQLLTLAGVARRLRTRPNDASALILLNAELALTLANLLFMVGVQATSDRDTCQRVAVGLHYLHLAVCCWFFTNSLHIYLSLRTACYRPKVLLYCLFSWLLPIPIIIGSLGGRGYETRFYCWMSARRGMLVSFMLPVSTLILCNTVLAVWGLRLSGTDDQARRALRVTATVLPAFAVLWFLGVLALENATSLLLSVLFVTTNAFLNWFIFGWWLRGESCEEEEEEEEEEEIYEEVCRGLLKAAQQQQQDDAWRRDADLQMDPICTISS